MDSSENRASGGERRLSTRRSLSVSSLSHGSDTEEGYDLADLSVADGFRPHSSTQSPSPPQTSLQPPSTSSIREHSPAPSHASASSSRPQDTQQSQLAAPIANYSPQDTSRSRPSSISKAHRPHESLTLRNDGTQRDAPQSDRPQLPTLTTGIELGQMGNGSGGLSGPSHPYQAYQQGTAGETGSATGDSPANGQYNGHQGPTHPYSLYPQTTAPLDDADGQQIPVGFNGMGHSYQRQIGPDGEDSGDLIGPDGHMEELPPYTRYPEQPFPTSQQAEASSATPVSTTTTPAAGAPQHQTTSIPGAGGMGMATRNPEFSSTEENLPTATGGRGTDSSDVSQSDSNNALPKPYREDPPKGKWRRRATKRLFGVIPYWAICMLIFALIIVGIVMGTVLGVLLSDNSKPKPDGDESEAKSQCTPAGDVDFYSDLPGNLPPLVTGLYDLPPLDVSQSPRYCFNDTTQAQSWSCEMPLRYYSLEVDDIENATDVENYEMQLVAINGSDSFYVWGTQPPSIADPAPLTLVNDTFQLSRGPAWWLQIEYDKTVLVSDSDFNSNPSKRSDWSYTGPPKFDPNRFMKSNPGPVDGEEAWICTWPKVTMEIFIYPSQNSSVSSTKSTRSDATTTLSGDQPSQTPYDDTPSYPQVVKFLERRLCQDGDDTAATCRKVRIVNDARDSESVLNDKGFPIVVNVGERDSKKDEKKESSAHEQEEMAESLTRRGESLELTDCGCLWFST